MYSHPNDKTNKAGFLGLILTAAVFFSLLACISHAEPLSVHPDNPRYLTDGSGEAIYLTGSHTWYLIQNDPNYAPLATDEAFTDFLDWAQDHGHNFVRLWTAFSYTDSKPYPWQRTGPGNAAMDGQPKFDMTKFNQDFFDRVKRRVLEVQSRGMYCSVMFLGSFNGIRSNFAGTAWHEDNNINSELASAFSDDGHSFCTTNSAALSIQRGLINKFVDELNDVDNLIFEIINEVGDTDSTGKCVTWHRNMVDYTLSYEAAKPKQHLVGMTGGWGLGNDMFVGNHEWISPDNYDMGYYEGGPADYKDKIVISDTDHLRNPWNTGWGFSQLQFVPAMEIWVWKTFTRGNHPLFMDWYDSYDPDPKYGQTSWDTINPDYDPVRDAMGYTLDYADRFADLASMVPSETISSTDYCLANPGSEYLIYQPDSDSFTVNLEAGDYDYEWFNPSTGVVDSDTGTITTSGGNQVFNPPFSGDAVLYIFTDSETCSSLGGSCCIPPDTCPGTDLGSFSDCSGICCSEECQTPSQDTCLDRGFHCCNSCMPGTEHPENDTDCPGVEVCCGECLEEPIQGDYNYSIIKTAYPPVIDADISEFANADTITITDPDTGTTGTYRLLWDDNALYIAAEFSDTALNADPSHTDDDELWRDDSLEIMFDTDNDGGDTSPHIDDYKFYAIPSGAYADSQRYDLDWDTRVIYAVSVDGTVNDNSNTDTGWVVEMAIPWPEWGITEPGFGSVWGMNIQLNDMTTTGKSSTQWSESDPSKVNIPDFWNDVLFTVRADTTRNGCVEQLELVPFIDSWTYDSTEYPMREMMEAVVLYYSPGTWCS